MYHNIILSSQEKGAGEVHSFVLGLTVDVGVLLVVCVSIFSIMGRPRFKISTLDDVMKCCCKQKCQRGWGANSSIDGRCLTYINISMKCNAPPCTNNYTCRILSDLCSTVFPQISKTKDPSSLVDTGRPI